MGSPSSEHVLQSVWLDSSLKPSQFKYVIGSVPSLYSIYIIIFSNCIDYFCLSSDPPLIGYAELLRLLLLSWSERDFRSSYFKLHHLYGIWTNYTKGLLRNLVSLFLKYYCRRFLKIKKRTLIEPIMSVKCKNREIISFEKIWL